MGLVAAKCTQCGANIEVDNTKEAGICHSCGTAFITQKAINNYNTHITQHVTKNIYGKERAEAEDLLANGETFIRLKDWAKATKVFMQAAEEYPNNYKAWLALVRSETQDFTDLNDARHVGHLEKAFALGNYDKYTEETKAVKLLHAKNAFDEVEINVYIRRKK